MNSNLKLKIIVFFLLVVACDKLDAQAMHYEWAKGIGGVKDAAGISIALDAAGNLYTTGFFADTVDFDPGSGVFNLIAVGIYDIFILKQDPQGNFLWAKSFGGSGDDRSSSIVLNGLGNIYATGFFSDTADFDPNVGIYPLISNGVSDIFVLKLNNMGNLLWAKAMGSSYDDAGEGIALDGAGNVYTTGTFRLGTSGADFDPGVGTYILNNAGNSYDIFVSKLNSLGNFVWAKSMGGLAADVGTSIATDLGGNVYITGHFEYIADMDPDTAVTLNLTVYNYADMFIEKLNSSGNLVWVKQMPSSGYIGGTSIKLDANANIYTTGFFSDTTDFDPGSAVFNYVSYGPTDFFISKLDGSGNFIWAKAIGGPSLESAYSIAFDNSGNSYTTGRFGSTVDFDPDTGVFNLTANYEDAFILKLDPAGNFIWAKSIGGNNWDVGSSIAVNSVNKIYVVGNFQSDFLLLGTDTLVNHGGIANPNEIFITKLSCAIFDTLTITTCNNSYTSPSGNYTWTTSGTYSDLITNATGCDNIFTINLNINHPTSSSQTIAVCRSYLSPSGQALWTTPGIHMDVIPNTMGCDSIITTNLIINNSTSTQTVSVCDSLTSPSGNYTWTSPGIYRDTIPNAIGCDSIIKIYLSLLHTSSTQNINACFKYLFGSTQLTASGTYVDTFTTIVGCDSIVNLNLTILTVDTSVSQNSAALFANTVSATYQWLNCNNGFAAIAGATNRFFLTTANGSYAVAIIQNGCIDTSACYIVTNVGLTENNVDNNFSLYPNPSWYHCTVSAPYFANATLILYDIAGRVTLQQSFNGNATMDLSRLANGVYIAEVKDKEGRSLKGKVVKE